MGKFAKVFFLKSFFCFTPEPVKYSTQSEYNTIGPGEAR
jgi:hypothetical protein